MSQCSENIEIEPETLADILLAIDACPIEISGLARVKESGNSLLIFGEPEIFPQTCSIAGTEFDQEAHGRWNTEMMRTGRGHEINEFRLWWHSHVFSAAYFSPTDKRQIESWSSKLEDRWISLVGNKYGSLRFRLDLYGKKRETIEDPPIKPATKITKEGLRAIMVSRRERILNLVRERVNFDPNKAFEDILKGVFHEA